MQSGLLAAGTGPATWVVGDLYTVKASGRETGGAFCLIEVIVPPESGPPPHIHSREDEAFYILEGQFKISIDGQERTAGPGSCLPSCRDCFSCSADELDRHLFRQRITAFDQAAEGDFQCRSRGGFSQRER